MNFISGLRAFSGYMRFINRSRASFWSSFRVLHAANRVRCSSVSSAGIFPPEKNCDKVIPNAWHTASRVGIGRGIVAFENVGDGGMGEAGLFGKLVACPAAFFMSSFMWF